ncbi:MAG: hypothetical protein AAFX06_09870 [Planctomycetota bacterium]
MSFALVMAVCAGHASTLHAQYYSETIIHSAPVYSTPVITYPSTPVYPSVVSQPVVQSMPQPVPQSVSVSDPVANCCGGTTTGDCTCKNLGSCELTLVPSNCRRSGRTTKTPIPFTKYGKIPKDNIDVNCYTKVAEFNYDTKVPTIECKTVYCKEIGKKTIQCEVDDCRPGCYFKVCVPINECVTKTVECKFVWKEMPHIIYRRDDPNRRDVYDVYVINDPDVNSPYHAGGMPKEWLIMHCATKAQVQAKFPNQIASNKGKKLKSQPTDADVDVELVVDQEMLQKAIEEEANAGTQKTAETEKVVATSDSQEKLSVTLRASNSDVAEEVAEAKVAEPKADEVAAQMVSAISEAMAAQVNP